MNIARSPSPCESTEVASDIFGTKPLMNLINLSHCNVEQSDLRASDFD